MKEKYGIGKILGYGCGSMAKDLTGGVIQSFLLIFYTDIFGIPAAAASIIFVVAKIWDAVNDPMMGAIVDRSPITKIGKYRPYVLVSSIIYAILCIMCFLSPNLSVAGKIAYAATTYTLMGMALTAYDVPLWAMIPALSDDENVQNKLISANRTITTIAMVIATGFTAKFVGILGGGNSVDCQRAGYAKVMVVYSVISVIFAIITFLSTKEKYTPQTKPQDANIFKDFKKVACKPLVFVLLSMVCCSMGFTLPSVSGTFYMIYYMGKPEMIGIYMLSNFLMGMVGTVIAPAMIQKLTAKKVAAIGFLFEIIVGIVIFVLGHGNLLVLLVCFAIIGVSVGLRMVAITAMLMDTVKYIAEKKGHRADGVCFSMNSFATKVGQALAGGAVSGILAVTGYVANTQQSASALTGILMTRSLFPAVLGALGLVFVVLWNVKRKEEA